MLKIGNFNNLVVARQVDHGVYLESSEGDILLPQKEVTPEIIPGNIVRVFIYTDSEDRVIATTETPKAQVGEFAYRTCTDTVDFGAFLNWGLEKDLFVPIKGQKLRMRVGQKYIVRLLLDQISQRILAVS
ncbi:GntR family transcriptional regulator, partial [bacterium]|nr:GntR family transcriptional regulator [bacterium]